MMKVTIASSTTTAKPKTSAGYISADLTWRRRASVFSTWKATRSSASSSRPDCSPERTMARKRRSKTFGWRSIACSSVLPASTSARSAADGLLDLLVLGLLLERVQGAQHRHARGDQGRELAREDGQLAHVDAFQALEEVLDVQRRSSSRLTSRTIRPRWRSCSVTWALDSASTSPAVAAPADVHRPEGEGRRARHRLTPLRVGRRCRRRGGGAHRGVLGLSCQSSRRHGGAPPSSRFSSSGTEARCSASARVILPARTRRARSASIVCMPTAPEVCTAA